MTSDRILLLFYGLPLAVLGLGLRRRLGTRGWLLTVPVCALVALYGCGVEWLVERLGLGLPMPVRAGGGSLRSFVPFAAAAVLLGAYGAFLVRFRVRGSDSRGALPR